jgi:non-ribosomal peptide synthetase component F
VENQGRCQLKIEAPFNLCLSNQGITPSTIFRGAWAYVLSLHSNVADIIFGAINSGREIPIDGINDMIGLCINTIPIRVAGKLFFIWIIYIPKSYK